MTFARLAFARLTGIAAASVVLLGMWGCGSGGPPSEGPAPVVTSDAPMSSDEAGKELDAQVDQQVARDQADARSRRSREY
jgi:hypothetical protein